MFIDHRHHFFSECVFAQSLNKEEAIKPSQILYSTFEVTRSIQGYTILDRKKYFNLYDQGTGFENRVSKEIYTELVQDYGVSFGRRLGGVSYWARELEEDLARPGFANLAKLKEHKPQEASSRFVQDFGVNLDVACHGNQ